jgi:hypothetical protein
MSFIRYNRILLSHLILSKPTRLVIPNHPSSIIIRHATEIRSRKPVKQRKNTVNPIAQIKKLGDKAGRMDFNQPTWITYIYIFSQDTFQ